MDNCTKAGSWELPTYQADLSLPQTQAKEDDDGLFKKNTAGCCPPLLPQWPALGTQMPASSLKRDAHRWSLVPG